MANAIEQAFIEILADTSNFDESIRKGTQDALRQAAARIKSAYEGIENQSGETAASVVRDLNRIARVTTTTRDPVTYLTRNFGLLEDQLRQLDGGEAAIDALRNSIKRLSNEILDGPVDSLDRLEEASERFGKQIRASLGRTAVGGVEQFEASLDDLAATGRREFDLLATNVKNALAQLGDIPGLERLEDQFEDMSRTMRLEFGDAVSLAEDKLRSLADRGELTEDALRDSVIHVSQLMDQQLGEAIDEVRTDLRLLAGEDRAFHELAEATQRWQRQVEQGNDSLRETAHRVDRVEEETEEATAQFRLFGHSARTASARANSGFGRTVAAMNRMRFLALDTRFILTGIGVFAAAQFARFGVEAASQIEQARLSFQTLARSIEGDVGDAFGDFREQATGTLDQVIEFARKTPFSLEQVTDGVRKISAFLPSLKIASDEALGTLEGRAQVATSLFEDMGAALAILGQQDAMDRLIKALGDVGAAGRLLGQDMRQIRNALPGINIREAIITGIYDPAVQADDSIKMLREEFGALGADATNAPQEATAAFVDLQRRGLISTTAVVQGLRASLNNLAGDDALEQFTLTIEGVIEKVREAAEVGSERGFRELGPSLVEQVIPALEDIEAATESFAGAMTSLAATSIPFVLDAFEEVTDFAGHLFDLMEDFAAENAPYIERAMEGLGEAVTKIADAVFVILDAIAPLGPAFLDVVNVGLDVLLPALEAVTPLIETIAEGIDALPPELIVMAIGFSRVAKGVAAVRAAGLANVTASFQSLALVRFAAISAGIGAVLIGLGNFSRYAREGHERAEELSEGFADAVESGRDFATSLSSVSGALDDLSDKEPEDIVPFIESSTSGMSARVEELRGQVDEYQSLLSSPGRLFGIGDTVNAVLGIDSLSFVDDLERARSELTGLERELAAAELTSQRFDDNVAELSRLLPSMADGLDESAAAAILTDDAIYRLLSSLGYTNDEIIELVNQPFGVFIGDVVDAIQGEGGLIPALRDAGIEVGAVDFDQLIDSGTEVAEVFEEAASQLSSFTSELLAATDPTFAAINARRAIAEAEQEIRDIQSAMVGPEGDFETQAEKTRALADARLALLESTTKSVAADDALVQSLAESGKGIEDVFADLAEIAELKTPDFATDALQTLQTELDLTAEEVIGLAEQFPSLQPAIDTFKAGLSGGEDALSDLQDEMDLTGTTGSTMYAHLKEVAEQTGLSIGQVAAMMGVSMDLITQDASDLDRDWGVAMSQIEDAAEATGLTTKQVAQRMGLKLGDVERDAAAASEGVQDSFSGISETFSSELSSLGEIIDGLSGGLWSRFRALGEYLMDGLSSGIDSGSSRASSSAVSAASRVGGSFENATGIASPSTVWAGYGRNLVEGLVLGINRNLSSLDAPVSAMFASLGPPRAAGFPSGTAFTSTPVSSQDNRQTSIVVQSTGDIEGDLFLVRDRLQSIGVS